MAHALEDLIRNAEVVVDSDDDDDADMAAMAAMHAAARAPPAGAMDGAAVGGRRRDRPLHDDGMEMVRVQERLLVDGRLNARDEQVCCCRTTPWWLRCRRAIVCSVVNAPSPSSPLLQIVQERIGVIPPWAQVFIQAAGSVCTFTPYRY